MSQEREMAGGGSSRPEDEPACLFLAELLRGKSTVVSLTLNFLHI